MKLGMQDRGCKILNFMSIRIQILLLSFLLTGVTLAQTRPNIIYIMADDLGYADLSGYGRKDYQTPNLDKMASQGIKFINAYAGGPLCTPTRTSFMTGRYPARTPVGLKEPLDWSTRDTLTGLSPKYPSIATLMKKSGYETYLVGKWHLGFLPEFNPLKNGFDEFFGFHGGGIDYISHTDPQGNNDLYDGEKPIEIKGYLTDVLTDKVIEIIKRKHAKPYFLSLMFNAPHWPWQAPGDNVYPLGNAKWKEGGSAATYAAMVKSMDDAVGRILEVLDELQAASNTVVIFTSDNGGERYSDMGELTGSKASLWEGGIKEPAFIKWTGKITPGLITSQVAITMDWTATILALANAKPDPAFPLDGIDLMPVCTGKINVIQRVLYWRVYQRSQEKAIRDGDWKYLQNAKGEYLFNLKDDSAEKNNLKEQQKDVFEKLKQKYAKWESTVLKPVPLGQ